MIEVRNLIHRYKNNNEDVLKKISFNIGKGQIAILLGSNGSGKTTLLRCINKLIVPVSGSIFIDGIDILKANAQKTRWVRRRIGFIFQELNLIERMTVLDNVMNGRLGYIGLLRTCFNRFREDDYRAALNSLQKMGLSDLKYKRVSNLSGGQKQRVAIARALSQEPEIILADEPVSSLDPKLREEIMALLYRVCIEKEITLIMSLHFVGLSRRYASRIIGINNGRIVVDDKAQKVSEKILRSIYVGP
jgi:phosphonate transport system ATP-binding protein